MKVKKIKNSTAERFVLATLELIEEKKGSRDVTLSEVAKNVGCAHTNAYNYFDGFGGLIVAALDRVLDVLETYIRMNLSKEKSALENLRGFYKGYIDFSIDHIGYYRFLNTDPGNVDMLPETMVNRITDLRGLSRDIVYVLMETEYSREASDHISDIITTYVEGDIANLINERLLDGQVVNSESILDDCMFLFNKLSIKNGEAIKSNRSRLEAISSDRLNISVYLK